MVNTKIIQMGNQFMPCLGFLQAVVVVVLFLAHKCPAARLERGFVTDTSSGLKQIVVKIFNILVRCQTVFQDYNLLHSFGCFWLLLQAVKCKVQRPKSRLNLFPFTFLCWRCPFTSNLCFSDNNAFKYTNIEQIIFNSNFFSNPHFTPKV